MNPDRTIHRSQLVRLLGTLASLVLLVYLLSQQSWQDILAAVRRIPPGSLAVVLVLLAVSRLAVTARWHTLLKTTQPQVRFRDSLRLTLAGLYAANFLPSTVGGDVVRAAGVLRISTDRVASAASIVVDRLIGLAGMLMVLPVGLVRLGVWLQASTLGAGLAVFVALGVVQGTPAGRWRGALQRLRRVATRMIETWRLWLDRPGALLTSLGFTWIHMVCLFSEIWLLLRGLGETASPATIAGLWSLSYFVTLLPVSINGLGLRELSVTYIFSELGAISVQGALTLALILRALDMMVSLPGAILISGLATARRPDRSGEA